MEPHTALNSVALVKGLFILTIFLIIVFNLLKFRKLNLSG